jgi:hypothetical protein
LLLELLLVAHLIHQLRLLVVGSRLPLLGWLLLLLLLALLGEHWGGLHMRLLLQLWRGHLILGRPGGTAWRGSEVLVEALLISHALRIHIILWCINPGAMLRLGGGRLWRKLLATRREGMRGGSRDTLGHASLAHLASHDG